MRIGIFTESYEPIINGVSVCVSTLRDELSRRGHEVFIFAPAYKGHVDKYTKVFRIPSTHTFFMRDYPFPIPVAPEIREIFKGLNLDIVHTQTPFILGVLGARWASMCGIPFVSTNHTLYTEYAHYVPIRPKALTKLFLARLMRWYYSGCNAVVVPSSPVEKILRIYGVKTRIEIIKTGVVGVQEIDNEHRRAVRQRYGVSDNEIMLLYVGRIAREKNLVMLLDAYKILLESHSNIKLVLVGGGPALVETRQYADRLGIGDKLIMAGMMPREAIHEIYASADIFVFPSTTETQGIAICEAMSAGLPIVGVDAGGIPENVRNGIDGFLTPNDKNQFAEKISLLIDNPDVRRQIGESAKSYSSNFSIERMVSDFEQFYSSVIS